MACETIRYLADVGDMHIWVLSVVVSWTQTLTFSCERDQLCKTTGVGDSDASEDESLHCLKVYFGNYIRRREREREEISTMVSLPFIGHLRAETRYHVHRSGKPHICLKAQA